MSTVYEVVGDVMGDVMGDEYDVGAEAHPALVAHPRGHWRNGPQAGHPGGGQKVHIAQKPTWRAGQAAPGVMLPDEGMVPLGMVPNAGAPAGTFAAATNQITWTGQLQKPFRAERLLVTTVRTGASAVGRLLGQFFVGVDLNMGAIAGVDIEVLGNPTAFGTRMTLLQAPPGVIISVPVTLSSALAGADTIFATVMFMGRIIH